ncbi:gliding motility-associated-like protein [Flavobacterium sp. 9]|nr:gliding motility-associated-like protein [Flavobacterium sp. 9]
MFLIVLLFVLQQIQSQVYVPAKGEITFFSPPHLGFNSDWATSRSSSPGYFNWLIASGNYTGVDDIHHINGYVKKYGSEEFTFPVGDGNQLRELSISAPQIPSDVYAVAWISGDPSLTIDPTNGDQKHSVENLSEDIVAVSKLGQWDWEAIRGTGEELIITVSIPEMTEIQFNDPSKLRLVGWNGTSWIKIGNTGASGLTNKSTLKGIMKEGIQAIAIGAIESVIIDSDGDSLPDTTEGYTTDTDSDGILNYLDNDDDGDGILTIDEHPDPNGDGLTNDAWDSNNNGIADYLDPFIANPVDEIIIYNAISPYNSDGLNDTFVIEKIELYPDNIVEIYDRWGKVVYETKGYNQNKNVFRGMAEGNTTYKQGIFLSIGTYFYFIKYKNDKGLEKIKKGYLYISN